MDVKNCRSCGRLFNYMGGPPICISCKEALEEKFQRVKEYIRDNKDAHVDQVSEECEVSVKQIKQWIREERLVLSEESGMFLECEVCGAAIRMGRYCDKCKLKVQGDLRGAYGAAAKPSEQHKESRDSNGNRMHFLDF